MNRINNKRYSGCRHRFRSVRRYSSLEWRLGSCRRRSVVVICVFNPCTSSSEELHNLSYTSLIVRIRVISSKSGIRCSRCSNSRACYSRWDRKNSSPCRRDTYRRSRRSGRCWSHTVWITSPLCSTISGSNTGLTWSRASRTCRGYRWVVQGVLIKRMFVRRCVEGAVQGVMIPHKWSGTSWIGTLLSRT